MSAEPLEFPDGAAWTAWLAAHQETTSEAWLRIGKKNAGSGLLAIGDALDGALCFGWIDAQRKGFDEISFLQRYCRRTARSSWSQVNVAKAEALIAAGRMQDPGYAEIAAAQADGRWAAAYVPQRDAEPPEELIAALTARPAALTAFEALSRSERYLLYLPVLKAVGAPARGRAVERVVASLTA
ncbi:OmdA domain containing protein [Nocardioides marmoriginsengisoli]|uniref:OmdA domain containing protein n=1 Tax=Nocardioides marmoriginsengisoli TaxID=661483 RepID=A0A3N0CN79_9ACTN|nr:YdeI/OmpD-associated family protein [Nocardioides marmoriginsengisoli]RNL64885.1 OmdA domain containing protein [Nocardioides marmoriginsengisoli]